jgi:hypothetical protein
MGQRILYQQLRQIPIDLQSRKERDRLEVQAA